MSCHSKHSKNCTYTLYTVFQVQAREQRRTRIEFVLPIIILICDTWELNHVVQINLTNGNVVPSHLQDIPSKPRADRNCLHLARVWCNFCPIALQCTVVTLSKSNILTDSISSLCIPSFLWGWMSEELSLCKMIRNWYCFWCYRGVLRIIFIVVWHLLSLTCGTLLPMQRNSMSQAVRLWRRLALLLIFVCV